MNTRQIRPLGSKSKRRLSLQARFMVYFGIVVVLLMSGVILVVEDRQYSSILQQTKMHGNVRVGVQTSTRDIRSELTNGERRSLGWTPP